MVNNPIHKMLKEQQLTINSLSEVGTNVEALNSFIEDLYETRWLIDKFDNRADNFSIATEIIKNKPFKYTLNIEITSIIIGLAINIISGLIVNAITNRRKTILPDSKDEARQLITEETEKQVKESLKVESLTPSQQKEIGGFVDLIHDSSNEIVDRLGR